MKASVILPTYNRMPVLKHCLESLLNQSVNNYEVILIDDCSDDGTENYIDGIRNEKLTYIRLDKNKGPYHARNLGVKRSKAELIIFVDSDVVVHPDFIKDHVDVHAGGSKLVLQGMVKHVNTVDEISWNSFYFPNAFCFNTFITQNISVKKKWLDEVGGFRDFGPSMGYKDVDMGLRLKDRGLKWVYGIRKCRAFHVDGFTTGISLKKTFKKWKQQGASAYFFVHEWGNRGEKIARTKKALFFSELLSTERWFDEDRMAKIMMESKRASGMVWFIMKGIARYHFRKRGIEEAMKK